MMWHRTQILITKEQYAWLRQQAYDKNISVAHVIRELIDEKRKEKTMPSV